MTEAEKTGTEEGASDQGSEKAPEKTADTEDRSKKLADSLAARGRELKAAEAAAKAAKEEAEALREERDQLRYEHKMSDAEKEEFRKEREAKTKTKNDPEKANLANENALLKAIHAEDNPAAKKALTKMLEKATASGKFPDAVAITALRESFEPDEDKDEGTEDEKDEKAPLKIKASRGTATSTVNIDAQIEQTKKDIKDGKATTADLYPLLQQRDQERIAARG